MYANVMLTLIFLVLFWIALGLQVLVSSLASLGKMFRAPTSRKLRQLERNNMPLVVKLVVAKTLSHILIRYLSKRL